MAMLDDLIAERTQKQDHGRRIAVRLQRIARIVVAPAATLMIVGLAWFAASTGGAGGVSERAVMPLSQIFSRTVMTPLGAMSAGLLALALLPMINVLYILADSLIVKRWADAAAAAVVAGILILSIFLGRA